MYIKIKITWYKNQSVMSKCRGSHTQQGSLSKEDAKGTNSLLNVVCVPVSTHLQQFSFSAY
jgi:hypothetical protein